MVTPEIVFSLIICFPKKIFSPTTIYFVNRNTTVYPPLPSFPRQLQVTKCHHYLFCTNSTWENRRSSARSRAGRRLGSDKQRLVAFGLAPNSNQNPEHFVSLQWKKKYKIMEFPPKLLPVRQVAWSRAVRFSRRRPARDRALLLRFSHVEFVQKK